MLGVFVDTDEPDPINELDSEVDETADVTDGLLVETVEVLGYGGELTIVAELDCVDELEDRCRDCQSAD